MSPSSVPEEARRALRSAMERHAQGDMAGALADARRAIELAPEFADARSYLGSTLVTRSGRYAEGLAELERAKALAPDDAAICYTLGWCYEFVAHGVSRKPQASARGGSASGGGLDPEELYRKAEGYLRRCLELHPEGKLKDDAQDLLASIIKEDVG
jgi:tetratricopeptide (TPR) repeat protein